MSVIDKDNGFKALQKRLEELKTGNWSITVGVHASAGEHTNSKLTVAEVAAIHEFGAPGANIPRRSFIGAWFDENGRKLVENSNKDVARYLKGDMPKEQVLARAGSQAVGSIQAKIAQGIPPPLKKETIDRKGSSIPLIDTGQLRTSITWAPTESK